MIVQSGLGVTVTVLEQVEVQPLLVTTTVTVYVPPVAPAVTVTEDKLVALDMVEPLLLAILQEYVPPP